MSAKRHRDFEEILGLKLDIERVGSGEPLLLLLSEEASRERVAPIVEKLAETHELIIPYAPGFGRSQRPDWIGTPDDIAYVMLSVVDDLKLDSVPVVGFSLGGWIALQMAVKDASFIRKMVLVAPYGVKIGGPYDREIADVWMENPAQLPTLKWADPDAFVQDYCAMPDDDVATIARERESFARFCWSPYMHDPRLKVLLQRLKTPTLFAWA